MVDKMNKTLFFANIKATWGALAFIVFMLFIYVATAIAMYDPVSVEAMEDMFKILPQGMLKAFGFDNLGTNMTGYLGHYFYGFIMMVFPIIYIVIAANKLIAKHVDSGSMAYLLTTPNTRVRIGLTQAVYLLTSLAVIFIVDVGILIIMSEAMHPGLLEIGKFLMLNLVAYLALAVVCGIAFFFSCLFSDARYSLAFGAGLPVIFLVTKMVSEISEDLEWVRFLSVYSVVDIDKILENGTYAAVASLILLGVVVVLFGAAIRIFDRKSLAI
jgi:ABC-2 type transport system permease protein